MGVLQRVLPPDLPEHSRTTARLDLWAKIAEGALVSGGPAAATVILKKYFEASDLTVAVLFSSASVGLLLTPWIPSVARRVGVIPFISVMRGASALLLALAGFMSTSWSFAFVLALGYISLNLVHPAVTAIYRQNYPTRTRGAVVAVVRAGANGAQALVGYGVGRMLNADPGFYVWIYPALGAFGLAAAVLYRQMRVHEEHRIHEASGARRGWRFYVDLLRDDKRYLLLLVAWTLHGFSNIMVEPVRAIYVSDSRFAMNADYLQSLLVVMIVPQLTMVVALPMWGKLLDRYPVTTLRVPQQLMAVANLLVFIFAPDLTWLYGAGVIRGVQMAGGQLMWTLVMMEFAPRDKVTQYGAIHTMLAGARHLTAPYAATIMLALVGPHGTFVAGILLTLVSVMLFALFPRITAGWSAPEGAPGPKRRAR